MNSLLFKALLFSFGVSARCSLRVHGSILPVSFAHFWRHDRASCLSIRYFSFLSVQQVV